MIVGIDLGTTHSLIGVYGESGATLIPNGLGKFLTPSVVSLDDKGMILMGEAAKERLLTHPEMTASLFKRQMGTTSSYQLGERHFRPEELSSFVLRALIEDVEKELGEKVTEAVISVPAYFSNAQRQATKVAGELAGIKVERLINEPTAAALAYGLQERESDSDYFLVLDLGGGTFDVSILEIFEGVVEVHASAGDNYLGGEDFTTLLLSEFCYEHNIILTDLTAQERGMLHQRIEGLKQQLSREKKPSISITLGDETYQWSIREEDFIRLAEPLIQRMRQPIERALRDAKLKPADLAEVVLVGGASRMFLVSRLVSKMFQRLPLRHIDPDQTIALGAAIAAGLKARNHKLEEIILTDVCPYTLGTEVMRQRRGGEGYIEGVFNPIIPRNTTVPVSRMDTFWPISDDQNAIKITIYQGENPRVENNIMLGDLTVNIPRDLNRDRSVDVRFTYNINGILEVEVIVNGTGEHQRIYLQHGEATLSEEEIRQRFKALNQLKIHPREEQENQLLLHRAERLYSEHLQYRHYIEEWIFDFQSVLETQDLEMIAEAREEFEELLDQFGEDFE